MLSIEFSIALWFISLFALILILACVMEASAGVVSSSSFGLPREPRRTRKDREAAAYEGERIQKKYPQEPAQRPAKPKRRSQPGSPVAVEQHDQQQRTDPQQQPPVPQQPPSPPQQQHADEPTSARGKTKQTGVLSQMLHRAMSNRS